MAREDIYAYQDHAGRVLYADPAKVLRIMTKHAAPFGGDLHHLIGLTKDENPNLSFPATESLLAGICEAFNLPSFDPLTGMGLSEDDLLSRLVDFVLWVKKKSVTRTSGMLPTSPVPIPAISLPSPPMGEGYPTSLSSGCG